MRPASMDLKPILTITLGLMWTLIASQAMGQLRVDLSSQNREWGSATLQHAKEGLYGFRNGIETEKVRAVRCSEGGELSTVQGKFVVYNGCGDLTWEFSLTPYPVQGEIAQVTSLTQELLDAVLDRYLGTR